MKKLTLIAHTQTQQRLSDLLRSMEQVGGYTLIPVEGYGVEREKESFSAAHDEAMGHSPRLRVELLLEDGDVQQTLEHIAESIPEIRGGGFYWVTPVEQGGHL